MSCTVKACRICLETDTKLYNYNHYELKHYYEQIITSNVKENDGLPCYFCYECAAMLHKFHKFKEKCYIGQILLRQLILKEPMTLKSVCSIKKQTENFQPLLNVVIINHNVKTVTIKKRGFGKDNRINGPLEIDAETGPATEDDDYDEEIELPPLIEIINNDKKLNINEPKINIKTDKDNKMVLPSHFLEDTGKDFNDQMPSDDNKDVNDIKETIDVKEYTGDRRKETKIRASNKKKTTGNTEKRARLKKKNSVNRVKKNDLNLNNWLKINLTEEQAVEEFKSRALEKRYISAKFRCDLCLKSFSKQDMLHRHNKLHSESEGPNECRFCHMRFRYISYLNRHIRQHFTKYKCLRCDLVCPFELSALSHEQYHNGVTKKCAHCGEEFKHVSTYYTHLRTHRSEHVCTLCGEAFISQLGLKMHQKRKHVITDTGSSQEAKEEQEFCKRCNIKFETKKAYEEHLIHSAMHVDGIEDSKAQSPILSNPKKVRPYHMRIRIPTDCNICGKHFDSQMAARKHHMAEHPRASFFAPSERRICEICGASLAPGSVQGHLKTHTTEKKFACSTCGRLFINKGGLTMHQLIHSSEKPVACTVCGSRFKRFSSMRIHHRTVHLKEPYPKRTRTKKNKRRKKEFQEISLFEDFSEDSKD